MQLSENLEVHVLSALLIDDDITTFVRSCLSSDIHVPSSLSFMNEEDSGSDSDSSPEKITCSFDFVLDGVMPKDMPTLPKDDHGQVPYPDQVARGELPPSSPPNNNIVQNTGGALVENTVALKPDGDGFSSCGGSYDMMLFDQFEIVSDGSAPVEHSYIIVKSVVVEDECAELSKEK